MIMVPCYNEGDNELRKTIKSVLNTTYPDENKVLFMVSGGLVTGNGEDMSTPEHLANTLGFDIDEFEDDNFEYVCIGVVHTKNRDASTTEFFKRDTSSSSTPPSPRWDCPRRRRPHPPSREIGASAIPSW